MGPYISREVWVGEMVNIQNSSPSREYPAPMVAEHNALPERELGQQPEQPSDLFDVGKRRCGRPDHRVVLGNTFEGRRVGVETCQQSKIIKRERERENGGGERDKEGRYGEGEGGCEAEGEWEGEGGGGKEEGGSGEEKEGRRGGETGHPISATQVQRTQPYVGRSCGTLTADSTAPRGVECMLECVSA